MANSSVAEMTAVRSAITGKLFWAPAGTALPTNSTTALAGTYVNLGHINEDGVQVARNVSVDAVKNDNGQKLLDLQTDFSKGFTATLYQVDNEIVNNMVYGDAYVTPTAGAPTFGARLAVIDMGLTSVPGVLVIEGVTYNGLGKFRRVVPYAQVTTAEEAPLVGTDVQKLTITWSASPDSTGAYDYTYRDNGVLVP